MNNIKKTIFVLLIGILLLGFKKANSYNEDSIKPSQLNITILLDLSDRIDPSISKSVPSHYERDISIVKYITEIFKKNMESQGTFMAKGKLKVIFSPRAQDSNVNIFAEKLNVDLSNMDNKKKKEIYEKLTDSFSYNLSKIYEATIAEKKWLGSDIWRFFKNDVKDYTICSDPNYRNILVILTDGYIYHADSKDRYKNRFAYLLPSTIKEYKLRNNPNWDKQIDKLDFGLISKRNDLENLEVLVLEINPAPQYQNDEDIIKKVLSKWFSEMGIKRYAIFNSDLPEYTKQRIDAFIK